MAFRKRPGGAESTPKKSVGCASVRVVLVMSEPLRLVFIGLSLVFVLVVPEIEQLSCQLLKIIEYQ